MFESIISLSDSLSVLSLFGSQDRNVRAMREKFGVEITYRDGKVRVHGEKDAVLLATEALEQLKAMAERHGSLAVEAVDQVLGNVRHQREVPASAPIDVYHAGRQISPRTPGQARYIDAIRKHDLVFAIGPSGTGKTYLAVAMAVAALKSDAIRKIVMVRPAVEAGERLGYLPGDLQAKINPYLRPLLDALREMMDYEQIKRYTEQDVIEVIPLAYMRGRTLNEAFIILDEAQNTTVSQMKMFLTRMGAGSKVVVSGDVTQTDLPPETRCGLTDAARRLKKIKGFGLVRLSNEDIVRHRLVQDIVRAYEENPE